MFGDHFDNQKDEQFPSRFRKQDYSSPKFVQQQKSKNVQGFRFSQIMEASLYSYDSPQEIPQPSITEQSPQIKKTQSQNKFKTKQYIVFPKIQQSIREQQIQDRNNVILQYANSPRQNLIENKSISPEALKMIYSQPYLHHQNVKRIRKISPESNMNHVCKKSAIIPQQQGSYTIPGLPHSENRSKKLNNLSFTKMQWNISNYNINFALSKKEEEIRDLIKQSRIQKPFQQTPKFDSQDIVLTANSKSPSNIQQTDFNFLTAYSKSPKSGQSSPKFQQAIFKQAKENQI